MRRHLLTILALAVLGHWGQVFADDKSQEALDQATEAKLTAENLDDLNKVIKLCQKALDGSLDDTNTKFAKQLLAGTLQQRAELYTTQIFSRPTFTDRGQLRTLALADLERAVKLSPELAEAHYLIARLQALGGDLKRAREALDAAVRLSESDPALRAKALLLRANLVKDNTARQADYDEAVKLAPHNLDVLRSRGLFHLSQEKFDKALADFDAALELNRVNAETHEARGLVLMMMKKLDEAKESFDQAIGINPRMVMAYVHRARIHLFQKRTDAALEDLDRVLKIAPRSLAALLLRSRVHFQAGNVKQALADAEQALRVQPESPEGLQLHAALAAGTGKLGQAIDDLEQLKKAAPTSVEVLMRLGTFYVADKQPQKAIENFDAVISQDAKNIIAYRGRADAHLSLGKQSEAIADYETALKLDPQDRHILNNLAWVLATSPNDKLRNGKRSVELATEACKVSEYKESHIVSTLAASYAETGDFATAIKWSKKALEQGTPELKDQLRKELESYEASKPWREAEPPDLVAQTPEGPLDKQGEEPTPLEEDADVPLEDSLEDPDTPDSDSEADEPQSEEETDPELEDFELDEDSDSTAEDPQDEDSEDKADADEDSESDKETAEQEV